MEERRLNGPLASVADLPDFPFPTFADFVEAQKRGLALVWVRCDLRTVWAVLEPRQRRTYLALRGNGVFVALLFGLLAYVLDDHGLLWVTPVLLLGFVFATPSPGLLNGCVPFALTVGLMLWGLVSGHGTLIALGLGLVMSWFLSCFWLGATDTMLREEMVQSEEAFLRLYASGVITRVGKRDPPKPDETVWPPPPTSRLPL